LSVEMISAIFTGLTGLLAGLAAVLATRTRRANEDSRLIRRQARDLQRKYLAAVSHIFVLETELALRGISVPDRPEALERDDDDDDGPPRLEVARAPA
jgi:hypothetical protein